MHGDVYTCQQDFITMVTKPVVDMLPGMFYSTGITLKNKRRIFYKAKPSTSHRQVPVSQLLITSSIGYCLNATRTMKLLPLSYPGNREYLVPLETSRHHAKDLFF